MSSHWLFIWRQISLETIIQKTALITGSAGFIGFHISRALLENGWRVIGIDCMSDYYDVSLKKKRENLLFQFSAYRSVHEKIEGDNVLLRLFEEEQPEIVIHLAAQAGVRHSLTNPRSYLDSNIIGTFELLEASRSYPPRHILMASTSSAFGANETMPFKEIHKADHQISFYAATKKSTEHMAHSYAHLFNLPITMLRFFTVYGPWGRPDMALFKFTNAIINGNPIDIYNNGNMKRDFTYIDDIVNGVCILIDAIPGSFNAKRPNFGVTDSISPVAPFRVVNIGTSKPEKLTHFIDAIEREIGVPAVKNFVPMQPGDVPSTWADTNLFKSLTGFTPKTDIQKGIKSFIRWYRDYYNC